jgi:hypothetical protein
MQIAKEDYQDVIDGNLFSIDPYKPYKAKGYYNPTTGDSSMQPWFPYEHKDNKIGYWFYDKFGVNPHKFVADSEFGGQEYEINY